MLIKMSCYKCGTEVEVEGKPFRRDECPKCSSYLHCCLNCTLYDPKAFQECREPMANWEENKEMGNLCPYFTPIVGPRKPGAGSSRQDEARQKLAAMFKKKP